MSIAHSFDILQQIIVNQTINVFIHAHASLGGSAFDFFFFPRFHCQVDSIIFFFDIRKNSHSNSLSNLCFGDFTSKYVLYKYSMEKADRKLSHEEAIQRASDAFVNYDIPTSAELQYMNDMGLMMFTKYRLRIQRAMLTLMKERPGSALAQSVLVSHFTNAPSALEPNIFTGFGDPFASSVLQLPGAATQPFPIKLLLGSM